MPGLFGILAKNPKFQERELLDAGERMAGAMLSVSWLRKETSGDRHFYGGRITLGVLNPEPQPLRSTDCDNQLWFDGQIYPGGNAGAKIPLLKDFRDYVQDGGETLSAVDGVFAAALYDATHAELTLASDRLGFRPLYYTQTDRWFAYAAEVKALLAILDKRPEIDEISLRQFFSFDHLLGERTWWKGIQLIPPATIMRVSASQITSKRYWSFNSIKRETAKEQGDISAEFGRLWTEAIAQRRKPGTMPFLLSGGLDSRALLAELQEQDTDVIALTYGTERCLDMKIAGQCAKLAGVQHRRFILTADNWWDHRDDAMWQTDGLVNALHLISVATEAMHQGSCYTLVNSTGDTLFGGSKLDDDDDSSVWPCEPNRLLHHMYLNNPFFTRDEVADASVPDSSSYLSGPSPDCWVISQRQRRMILMGPMAVSSHCEVVNPGVTLSILKLFLGSLNDEERRDSKFYIRFLLNRYPQYFVNIPWQKTGRGLSEHLVVKWQRELLFRMDRILRTAVDKASVKVPGMWRVSRHLLSRDNRNLADYGHFVKVNRVREKLCRTKLLADDLLRGLLKRSLLDQAGSAMSPRVLTAIVTLESYLRRVEGLPPIPELTQSC
jgi:asparagine synthetase B (glutamine-hydrolysing)